LGGGSHTETGISNPEQVKREIERLIKKFNDEVAKNRSLASQNSQLSAKVRRLEQSEETEKQMNEEIESLRYELENETAKQRELSQLNQKLSHRIAKTKDSHDTQLRVNQELEAKLVEQIRINQDLRKTTSPQEEETILELRAENEQLSRQIQQLSEKIRRLQSSESEQEYFESGNEIGQLRLKILELESLNRDLTARMDSGGSAQNAWTADTSLSGVRACGHLFCVESLISDNSSLTKQLTEATHRIEDLRREIIIKDGDLIKLRNVTSKSQSCEKKFCQFGFLLADAICQRFNPSRCEEELKRLIDIAHREHIELSETVRVKLNPYSVDLTKPSFGVITRFC
jgi:DNA repair exonuclease SbcCD ATPase subunit